MAAQRLINDWIACGVKMQVEINQPVHHDQFPLAAIVSAMLWSEWCKTCQFPTCSALVCFQKDSIVVIVKWQEGKRKELLASKPIPLAVAGGFAQIWVA